MIVARRIAERHRPICDTVQELPHARIAILLQRLRAAVGDDLFVSHNLGVISDTQHFRHVVGNHHAGDAKGAVQLRN